MNVSGKKVLIAGGAGFIGSHIARHILTMGAHVTIFDNLKTGTIANIEDIQEDIEFIRGDIRNADEISEAVKGHDVVVHEAFPYAMVSQSVEEQFIEDSYMGTFNVLKASLYGEIEKVVYASSVAVYGQQQYLPVDEEHPKNPDYPYGATKYACEKLCASFSKSYSLNTVSLRYFNVYGPLFTNLGHSAVLSFIRETVGGAPPLIYGDGTQVRDYTFIDDIVDGTILAITEDTLPGDSFNLGTGTGISIWDLARKIVEISGGPTEPRLATRDEYRYFDRTYPWGITKVEGDTFIDTRNYIADITKATRQLGYAPKVSVEEGIRKTFLWAKGKAMINNG